MTDIARSFHLYEQLGFSTIDPEGDCGHIGWARMHCESGALMLLEAQAPAAAQGRKPIYMCADDLAGLREQLIAGGAAPSPISHRENMERSEFRVEDSDGHVVLIGHWGRAEQEAWKQCLAERRKAVGK